MTLIALDRYKKRNLKIGPVWIRPERFPWQIRRHAAALSSPSEVKAVGAKYGWRATDGTGRFGGGWNWKLGIDFGGSSMIINLIFGYVRVTWHKGHGG